MEGQHSAQNSEQSFTAGAASPGGVGVGRTYLLTTYPLTRTGIRTFRCALRLRLTRPLVGGHARAPRTWSCSRVGDMACFGSHKYDPTIISYYTLPRCEPHRWRQHGHGDGAAGGTPRTQLLYVYESLKKIASPAAVSVYPDTGY
eukprot:scaffold4840_cov115-Isochrysis_galbana.AAC.6